MLLRGKRGQITLFVIAAIVIVTIFLVFIFIRGSFKIQSSGTGDVIRSPGSFIDTCLKPEIEKTAKQIETHGSYVNATLYHEYENENIGYLCFQENYYLTCINQESLLIQHIKAEIKQDINDDVQRCFNELENAIKAQGGEVKMNSFNSEDFNVDLKPKTIMVNIEREVDISKSGESARFETFTSVVRYNIYDLALVVQEINNQEARFCNFEQQGFMLLYSGYDIDKLRLGDGTIIYTVTHRQSHEYFRFAVRSCVIPPGVG